MHCMLRIQTLNGNLLLTQLMLLSPSLDVFLKQNFIKLPWCVRHTDLKHKDKTESYGEEVKVLGEVFTVFIPETLIPATKKTTLSASSVQTKYLKVSTVNKVIHCKYEVIWLTESSFIGQFRDLLLYFISNISATWTCSEVAYLHDVCWCCWV